MTVPTITALPEIPAYSDANFETKAPAVLSALRNTFIAEMNAAIAAINSYDYGAAVNISKVVGLTAGYIPYGAGTAALASSANFVFSSNRLDLTNPSGAQARLTHSSGKYTDFKTDGDGNLTIAPSGGNLNITGTAMEYGVEFSELTNFDSGAKTGHIDVEFIKATNESLAGRSVSGIYEITVNATTMGTTGIVYMGQTLQFLSVSRRISEGLAKHFVSLHPVFTSTSEGGPVTIAASWFDQLAEVDIGVSAPYNGNSKVVRLSFSNVSSATRLTVRVARRTRPLTEQ